MFNRSRFNRRRFDGPPASAGVVPHFSRVAGAAVAQRGAAAAWATVAQDPGRPIRATIAQRGAAAAWATIKPY